MLNGYHALAYCRLRKALENLPNKLSKASVVKYPQLLQILLIYMDVNISADKILDLALKSRILASYDIK